MNHYSGHIPMSAVNVLIIDQLSHYILMGILATTLLIHSLTEFLQQSVFPNFELNLN